MVTLSPQTHRACGSGSGASGCLAPGSTMTQAAYSRPVGFPAVCLASCRIRLANANPLLAWCVGVGTAVDQLAVGASDQLGGGLVGGEFGEAGSAPASLVAASAPAM